jgi:hypothetical protein
VAPSKADLAAVGSQGVDRNLDRFVRPVGVAGHLVGKTGDRFVGRSILKNK